ncbi:MAG: hypothetical protein AAF195_03645 [Pseudomonadota bacterium]
MNRITSNIFPRVLSSALGIKDRISDSNTSSPKAALNSNGQKSNNTDPYLQPPKKSIFFVPKTNFMKATPKPRFPGPIAAGFAASAAIIELLLNKNPFFTESLLSEIQEIITTALSDRFGIAVNETALPEIQTVLSENLEYFLNDIIPDSLLNELEIISLETSTELQNKVSNFFTKNAAAIRQSTQSWIARSINEIRTKFNALNEISKNKPLTKQEIYDDLRQSLKELVTQTQNTQRLLDNILKKVKSANVDFSNLASIMPIVAAAFPSYAMNQYYVASQINKTMPAIYTASFWNKNNLFQPTSIFVPPGFWQEILRIGINALSSKEPEIFSKVTDTELGTLNAMLITAVTAGIFHAGLDFTPQTKSFGALATAHGFRIGSLLAPQQMNLPEYMPKNMTNEAQAFIIVALGALTSKFGSDIVVSLKDGNYFYEALKHAAKLSTYQKGFGPKFLSAFFGALGIYASNAITKTAKDNKRDPAPNIPANNYNTTKPPDYTTNEPRTPKGTTKIPPKTQTTTDSQTKPTPKSWRKLLEYSLYPRAYTGKW